MNDPKSENNIDDPSSSSPSETTIEWRSCDPSQIDFTHLPFWGEPLCEKAAVEQFLSQLPTERRAMALQNLNWQIEKISNQERPSEHQRSRRQAVPKLDFRELFKSLSQLKDFMQPANYGLLRDFFSRATASAIKRTGIDVIKRENDAMPGQPPKPKAHDISRRLYDEVFIPLLNANDLLTGKLSEEQLVAMFGLFSREFQSEIDLIHAFLKTSPSREVVLARYAEGMKQDPNVVVARANIGGATVDIGDLRAVPFTAVMWKAVGEFRLPGHFAALDSLAQYYSKWGNIDVDAKRFAALRRNGVKANE